MARKKDNDLDVGIGKRLCQLRKCKKLNQGMLGKAFELAPSSIGSYERGKILPSIAVIIKYADYFNVTTDYIIRGHEAGESDSNKLRHIDLGNLSIYEEVSYKGMDIARRAIPILETLIGGCIELGECQNSDTGMS